jgi:hypothetical protein
VSEWRVAALPASGGLRRRRSDIATLRLVDEPRLDLVESRHIAVEVVHDAQLLLVDYRQFGLKECISRNAEVGG